MLDGEIEPGMAPGTSPGFREAMMGLLWHLLYALIYVKAAQGGPRSTIGHGVGGLWWVEGTEFDITKPEGWKYRLMMMQPEHISAAMFQEALVQLRAKRGDQPAFVRLRLERFKEGLCIQVMHIGPYSTRWQLSPGWTAYAQENGYELHGKHHEIYIGDPMKAAPEKLKTILRHPVMKV